MIKFYLQNVWRQTVRRKGIPLQNIMFASIYNKEGTISSLNSIVVQDFFGKLTPQFDYILLAIEHSKYNNTMRSEEH